MELRHKPQERDTIYKKLLWQIESNQRSSKNKYLDLNQNFIFKIKNGPSPIWFLILEFSGKRLQVQDVLSSIGFLIFLVSPLYELG